MALEDLLAKDTITVEQLSTTTDASGGVVGWTFFATGPGRVEALSAAACAQFASLGALITHLVYTQLEGIEQGWRILTSDGLTLRVENALKQRQLGIITTYYMVTCRQIQI